MRRLLVVLLLVVSGASFAKAKKKKGHSAKGAVLINGEQVEVKWSDGDSFKFKSGKYEGRGTRLVGFNTLEAYGPVHRWGTWTPQELFALAESSSQVAGDTVWTCTTDGKVDGYGRVLVDCPDLAEEMIRQGQALAYAVEGTSPERLLAAQREAMAAGRGMWARGVVKGVITSLHSAGEDGGDDEAGAYNRVVDTRTGSATKRAHQKKYATCEEVCETTDGDVSCMVYVPFKHRYKNKPDCLK
ncbi:MAG: thermonuclease family protein [Myxococcus sp.]|nr:thermonuclease family protein [Myxococcus sp.]